jgi:hypothetical protein
LLHPEQIKEQLDKCQQEKDELEKRCKKLMNSIGAAANAREVSVLVFTSVSFNLTTAWSQVLPSPNCPFKKLIFSFTCFSETRTRDSSS